mgnify:CR=1 FL=1
MVKIKNFATKYLLNLYPYFGYYIPIDDYYLVKNIHGYSIYPKNSDIFKYLQTFYKNNPKEELYS